MLKDWLQELENRSHRNDLRAVDLPESVKYSNLQALCEADLPQALGLNHKCRIERVHRIGPDPERAKSGSRSNNPRSRQVIMKFLDFNDKAGLSVTTFPPYGAESPPPAF